MDGLSCAANVFAAVELTASVVKICARFITEVKNARDDIIALQRSVAGLGEILRQLKEVLESSGRSRSFVSSSLIESLNDCLLDLGTLNRRIDPKNHKGIMRKFGIRAMKWPLQRPEVEKMVTNLERYKSSFILSIQVDQTGILTKLARDTESTLEHLRVGKLPMARGAEFDSYMDQHEDVCLSGTRIELLRQATEWASSSEGTCIFWLNGMAGTGKSTISRTLARSFKEAKILGASFFFKRGEGDRANASKLFSTITRQLVVRIPQLIPEIEKTLEGEPDIAGKSLKEQFNKLILRPILSLQLSELPSSEFSNLPLVIMLDALDECARDEDIRVILRLLPTFQDSTTIKLRVFLTSRPELPIRMGISQIPSLAHQDVALHEIAEPVVQHDISLFLTQQLWAIRKDRDLSEDWPGESAIKSLVELSAPLFIFAATACRILADPMWDPEDTLTKLLAYQKTDSELDGIPRFDDMSHFDKTYLPVLDGLLEGQSQKQTKQLIHEFHEVVGAIMTLECPLSVASLARLLAIPEKQIFRTLGSLHSVLRVPTDSTQLVRLFHLSFRDFLLDPETKEKTRFWIDEGKVHQRLFARCLETCGALRKNICGREDDTKRQDIERQVIDQCLPPDASYSCHYWAYHLLHIQGLPAATEDSLASVDLFLRQHCLHWMEAMRILGLSSEMIDIIDRLQSLPSVQKSVELCGLLHDAKRFALKTAPIANDMTLQLYSSGLLFAPKESVLRRNFIKELPNHGSVHSVAISFDGDYLASGSGDETIKIWDLLTGTLNLCLEGHSGRVHSVAFSSNEYLASGSSDNTVRVWIADTGSLHLTLKGHSDWVNSVAFSPDGQLLASGSDDETIKLWNASTGSLQQTLQGHSARIRSVAFSSSGLLASGSDDGTVKLWDPKTGVVRRTLVAHSDWVKCVAFSANGRFLASSSYDKSVVVWDSSTGDLLQTLNGHSEWVNSVSFSPDGRTLASCSKDKTIRIWNPYTGDLQGVFDGHSGSVLSVVFSSCGQFLASGGYDKTTRLWDSAMKTKEQKPPSAHSEYVHSISFSPDGGTLAAGSRDTTVRLWDSATGTVKHTLSGHSLAVRVVIFSPNGLLLASGSYDKTIRIWDSSTGILQQVLEGHSSRVRSLAFSPDSKLLASISNDETLFLWDLASGIAIKQIVIETWQKTNLTISTDDCHLSHKLELIHIQSWFKSHAWSSKDSNIRVEDEQCILLQDRKAIWLPSEYRPSCSTAKGNILAMGHPSGRVTFTRFNVL
ncbi:NACHT and WD40 domain protein [Penicillium brevicompactum]|uniref:NACHT and WD40 domain protein n=1 Tax=Penicillium brevicompactum TaxID=5074 RepID=UPI0025409FB6|nr:NACHT and WD40 domain protein [Penicillium brevicompactum]KAJ5319374.1 NACHT and WD40 domain protein [Penicillium brevicompactum]